MKAEEFVEEKIGKKQAGNKQSELRWHQVYKLMEEFKASVGFELENKQENTSNTNNHLA